MFRPTQGNESRRPDPFTFVTVGSLVPVKGYDLVLRALAITRQMAPHIDFRLRIVGVGPLRQQLARLTEKLGLMGYVEFVSEVPHEQLPSVYSNAHAFVIGSWHEAQCMAALEAMSCGLPWIGPRVGALADAAAASAVERSGVSVTRRTPQAFAQAIHYMLTRPDYTRLAWGKNARAKVERDYDLKTQAARLLQLVGALTAARQGS
jgi:phosphatidylinositol alpha-1,6-mannosyltransferase